MAHNPHKADLYVTKDSNGHPLHTLVDPSEYIPCAASLPSYWQQTKAEWKNGIAWPIYICWSSYLSWLSEPEIVTHEIKTVVPTLPAIAFCGLFLRESLADERQSEGYTVQFVAAGIAGRQFTAFELFVE